jgi:hypothetical protein
MYEKFENGPSEAGQIRLTQGKVAIVDAEDFEWLSKFKWHAHKRGRTWYARRTAESDGSRQTKFMHREILERHSCDLKEGEVDHINGEGLDNRKLNLQVVTHAENIRKSRIQSGNKSGFRGVSWHKRDRRWQAHIQVVKVRKYLGSFKSKIAAALAYDRAAEKYFGRFARLNFPDRFLRTILLFVINAETAQSNDSFSENGREWCKRSANSVMNGWNGGIVVEYFSNLLRGETYGT